MNDNDRRRWDALVRSNQFGQDNAPDFPSGLGHTHFTNIQTIVGDATAAAAAQAAGTGEMAEKVTAKASAREDLREMMSAIARTAKSMEYAFPGISDEFRFKANLADADLLATARGWYNALADNEADFIAYGLPATFRDDLDGAASVFETGLQESASAKSDKVAATANIAEQIRQGMISLRILDAIVRNKYANDPGKLAAWHTASHVEAAPKKKKDTTGGPTPPTP